MSRHESRPGRKRGIRGKREKRRMFVPRVPRFSRFPCFRPDYIIINLNTLMPEDPIWGHIY